MQNFNLIQQISISIIPIILALTLHEGAHALCAYRLGDRTGKLLGRLTLNPVKHIDPVGTILFPLLCLALGTNIFFGWGKLVPIDQRNLSNPKRDMAFICLAGPIANLLMACLWAFTAKLLMLFAQLGITIPSIPYSFFFAMSIQGICINAVLAILNLIPIPPLDGSKVLNLFLNNNLAMQLAKLEPYGIIIIILLLTTGILNNIMSPGVSMITSTLINFVKF